MFGRRRHAAALAAARVPQLTEAQILELVSVKLGEFIGSQGAWSVSRRSDEDTDAIFQDVLTSSIAAGITGAIITAKLALESGEPVESGIHVAVPVNTTEEMPEPSAFGWEPAPITVWTDLRRPVTGEIPQVFEQALVA